MKVLMFGWEFPPKIYGGLAVASYGITKGLSLQGDMETIFCMPKPSGEEERPAVSRHVVLPFPVPSAYLRQYGCLYPAQRIVPEAYCLTDGIA